MIIYRITNIVNKKTYIGKTTKSLEERFQRHIYNHKNGNTYLYKAMKKYGAENFSIEIIEETQNLDDREQFWISKLSPEYNMTTGGEGGNTSSSPNFIKAMKIYHSKKTKQSYATYGMLGKKSPLKGKPLYKNYCPVMCEGKEYISVRAAELAYPGISLRKRLDNPKYPQFYRLRQKTMRSQLNVVLLSVAIKYVTASELKREILLLESSTL